MQRRGNTKPEYRRTGETREEEGTAEGIPRPSNHIRIPTLSTTISIAINMDSLLDQEEPHFNDTDPFLRVYRHAITLHPSPLLLSRYMTEQTSRYFRPVFEGTRQQTQDTDYLTNG